jgi:outer membrane receptor protein involved in Fe transport
MYQAQCDADAALGPFVNSSDKLTFSNVDQESVFVTALWNSGQEVGFLDAASFRVNASYRYIGYEWLQDREFSPFRIDALGTIGDEPTTNTTRNLELIFEGVVNDQLNFIVGMNYFDDEALTGDNSCYRLWVDQHDLALDNDVECLPQSGLLFELVPDKVDVLGRPFTAGPPTFFKNGSVWNESVGVFGHLTYSLNDNWDLDFGIRYTDDKREFNNLEFHISNYQRTNDLGLGSVDLIMNNLTVVENGFFNAGSASFSEVTPMISLTRRLDERGPLDDGMFYLLYAEGFLTGGFNNELNTSASNPAADLLQPFQAYDPERLDSYEIGFKGTFGDGRVRLSSALFFMDYSDIQEDFVLDNGQGQFGGGGDLIRIVSNVAEAEIFGIELELRSELWRGGFATLDVGHTDYKTSEYTFFDEEALALGEFRLIDIGGGGSEDWTINASLEHVFQLGNGASLTPMIGAYRESNKPVFGPLDGPGLVFEYCQRERDYTKWRARLTYEPADSGYQIALYGNNITDERIFEVCGRNRGAYGYRYERPASWGIEFSARWATAR